MKEFPRNLIKPACGDMFDHAIAILEAARADVVRSVNSNTDRLLVDRAGYGKRIVHALSAQLHQEHGQGFTKRILFNMIRFGQVFPEEKIVSGRRNPLIGSIFEYSLPSMIP